MSFELEQKVLEWAEKNKIFEESNSFLEQIEIVTRLTHLRDSLVLANQAKYLQQHCKLENNRDRKIIDAQIDNDKSAIKEELGYVLARLIILAKMEGISLDECLKRWLDAV